jgi:hypothetical protein
VHEDKPIVIGDSNHLQLTETDLAFKKRICMMILIQLSDRQRKQKKLLQ